MHDKIIPNKSISLVSLLYLFTLSFTMNAAIVPMVYDNKVYEEDIRTVILTQKGTHERLAVMSLNTQNRLHLRFDQMQSENEYFQYTFVHCSSDWKPSNLQPFDYLEGDLFQQIEDFDFSRNTFVLYTNYQVVFPNENMYPKISGNYILKVFRNFDQDDIVLTRRFMVVDDKFKIDGKVSVASKVDWRFKKHEVDFVVSYENFEIPNPLMDVNAVILQNVNWSNAIMNLKPRFLNRGELNFNYDAENTFWAGNEFRFFDIRSLRAVSPGVRRKYNEGKQSVADLYVETSRAGQPYLEYRDFNGKMVVENKDGAGFSDVDADYVKMIFEYRSPSGILDNPIYVFGELSDWQIKDEFELKFDKITNNYRLEILLKQGYYDYWYVNPNEQGMPDLTLTEGNHFNTENDYHVLIYHRNQFLRYDELLGVSRFSSAGRQ
jgi:hypothetical protein